jgi:hypothetical protein
MSEEKRGGLLARLFGGQKKKGCCDVRIEPDPEAVAGGEPDSAPSCGSGGASGETQRTDP